MAKIELKFIDAFSDSDFIIAHKSEYENVIRIYSQTTCEETGEQKFTNIFLDKSTSIKFAKTLRTEINKIQESEVGNG